MQPKAGGKLQLRLKTGIRPIVNQYHKGKLERILKGEFKKAWNLKGKQVGSVQSIQRIELGSQSGPDGSPADLSHSSTSPTFWTQK